MADWRRNMKLPPKDPDAVKDFEFDWRDWLTDGEVIASVTVTPAAGLTLDVANVENTNTTVRAWFSGGTDGTDYAVVCKITTDSVPARTELRSVTIQVAVQ